MKSETFLGRAVGPVTAFLLTPDLRRGVMYRMGRSLNDDDVLRILNEEIRAILDQYRRLGAWVARIDATKPRDPSWATRRLSGITKNNPDDHERARRSASMKAVWAARKARARAPSTRRT